MIDGAPEGFNNDRQRPGLVLEEADGYRDIGNFYFDRQDLTEGTRADPFHDGVTADGTAGIDGLGGSTTSPNTRTNTGLSTGVEIEVLSPLGDSMRVRLHFARSMLGWPRLLPGARRLQAADLRSNGGIDLIAEGAAEVVVFRDADREGVHLSGSLLAASRDGLFLSSQEKILAYEEDHPGYSTPCRSVARWLSVGDGSGSRHLR